MAHFYDTELKRPTSFNFASDVVDYWATHSPPADLAMHWISSDMQTERRLTFSHFSRQSHRLAVLLREKLGIRAGERLLIVTPRVPEWWELATACIRCGIVVCPATTLLVEKDIEDRARRSGASIFVGDETSVAKCLRIKPHYVASLPQLLQSIPQDAEYSGPKPNLKHPALIYFTSGTTGPPKMVQHNQISYPLAHTLTGKHFHRLRPGRVAWVLTEQGWAKAAWAYFGAWNCGAGLFVHDDRAGAFDGRRTLGILNSYEIHVLCAPPTVYRQLVVDEMRRFVKRPKALVHCTGAGEPLNPEVIRLWREMTGLEICDGFGQSETVLVCGNFEGVPVRPGSMGRPSPGVPLHVIDEEGNECAKNVEGDIALKVDLSESSNFFGVFDGYLGEDGSLDRRLRSSQEGESWYLTGDRATRDGDGYFWFVGRSDDVINSAGYRIGPFEVESTLKQHPSVIESAVVSSPSESRGEVVKAFIVITDQAREKNGGDLIKELQEFCKANAAPYKYPRKIEFVDAAALPKTISGKIQRKRLKEMEWSTTRSSSKL